MNNTELINKAKQLCDDRDKFLNKYRYDVEYVKLKQALDALPTAYNKWTLQILSTPVLGKTPMNPFVAAGIGDGIAGLGGAVIMGVSAQQKMNAYNDRLHQFEKNYASITTYGEKVAFLVDTISTIVKRSPINIDSNELEDEILTFVGKNPGQSVKLSPEAIQYYGDDRIKEATQKLENRGLIVNDISNKYDLTPYAKFKEYADENISYNHIRRKNVYRMSKAICSLFESDIQPIDDFIDNCENDIRFAGMTKKQYDSLISSLLSYGVIARSADNIYTTIEDKELIHRIRVDYVQKIEAQDIRAEELYSTIEEDIAKFNEEYRITKESIQIKTQEYNIKRSEIEKDYQEEFPQQEYLTKLAIEIKDHEEIIAKLSGIKLFLQVGKERNTINKLTDEFEKLKEEKAKFDTRKQAELKERIKVAGEELNALKDKMENLKKEKVRLQANIDLITLSRGNQTVNTILCSE